MILSVSLGIIAALWAWNGTRLILKHLIQMRHREGVTIDPTDVAINFALAFIFHLSALGAAL